MGSSGVSLHYGDCLAIKALRSCAGVHSCFNDSGMLPVCIRIRSNSHLVHTVRQRGKRRIPGCRRVYHHFLTSTSSFSRRGLHRTKVAHHFVGSSVSAILTRVSRCVQRDSWLRDGGVIATYAWIWPRAGGRTTS